jgi:ribosome-binding factor A
MVDAARARKLADRIKVVAAETIERRVKDPRLGFVTVTDVRVTADLHDATIFYTVLGDETVRRESEQALESAKGLVRAAVGRETQVRFTPTITFVADVIPETSKHLEDLIASARAADDELARAAADAQPAGDPDPYRHPDEDDADFGDRRQ